MKGKIKKEIKGFPEGNPYGFEIKGEDGKTYFAHLGDLKKNEDLLYKEKKTEFLKKNDDVEFSPWEQTEKKHAIHVKKY